MQSFNASVRQSISPGPGAYSVQVDNGGPHYTIGGKHNIKEPTINVPGPGAYESASRPGTASPSYSLGGKPSLKPIITEGPGILVKMMEINE
jgi:hypothetical protein